MIGGHGTGKTCFLDRHSSGQFIKEYVPTLSLTSKRLSFNTSKGFFTFDVFDCPVEETSYLDIKCDVVFCFYTSQKYEETQRLIDEYLKRHHDVLVISLWGLGDVKEEVLFLRKKMRTNKGYELLRQGRETYQISGLNNYNYEKPFLYAMRKLIGDQSLRFV